MKKSLFAATALGMLLCSCTPAMAEDTVTLDFEANASTGYSWTAFILGGYSIEITDPEGTYLDDTDSDMTDGAGGTTSFTVKALQPGRSLIRFTYGHPWEMEEESVRLILADVDEAGNLTTTDVTDTSEIKGSVTELLEEENCVVIHNEEQGEIRAYFTEDVLLPQIDEEVCLYTDGTMTMSLPPIVNVLAWGAEPSDLAREEAFAEEETIQAEEVSEIRLQRK